MTELPNLISHLAPLAERYLTLLRIHPSKKYNYAKRRFFNLPVIDVVQHGPKCKPGESWLYFAVPESAILSALASHERLYVGAQTQDRMFRGDGLDGSNYHHGEMRAGNGTDNPVTFLASGQRVTIYRISATKIQNLISDTPALAPLRVLAKQPRTPTRHLGWWYEQYVLYSEPKEWQWNTAKANKSLVKLFVPMTDRFNCP